jgi:gliding motility-associated-like protein
MFLSKQKYFRAFLCMVLPFTKMLHAQIGFSSSDLTITAQVVRNANCNQKGILLAQAKDGLDPYEYQIVKAITPGSSPIPPPPPTPTGIWVASNTFYVDEGSYLIIARDQLGMEATTTVTLIKDPVPKTQLSLTNNCVPEGNFELQLGVTAPGISPYFLSKNGSVFERISLPLTLSNQNSGSYNYIIKDTNGCEMLHAISIQSPLQLSAKAITHPSCLSNDGEVTLATEGGSSDFEYSVNGGVPTANSIFTNLSSGRYSFRVDDKITGCFDEIEVNLSSATAVTGLQLTPTSVKCRGRNDGSIIAIMDSPTIGVNDNPTYKYSIDGVNFQESNVFLGLSSGTYTIEVISGRGCVARATTTVTEPASITVSSPIAKPFSCISDNNFGYASISVGDISGGSASYTQFEFLKNNQRVQYGASPTYIESDLSGGKYSVVVYDTNGCSGYSSEVTLDPFVALEKIKISTTAILSCRSLENIQVSTENKGGNPLNLEFSLVDIQLESGIKGALYPLQTNSSGIFTALSAGKYRVTVLNKDTGCSLQEIYTVLEPNTFDLKIESVLDVSCHNGNDGAVTFTFIDWNNSKRSETISYEISNQTGSIILQNINSDFGPISIKGLSAGSYTLKITLSNFPFCSVTQNFSIQEPDPLVASLFLKAPLHCGIQPELELHVAGGTAPYFYSNDSNINTIKMDNTSQKIVSGIGTYTYYVKDAKGCSSLSNTVVLNSLPGLQVTVDETLATINCKGDATATLIATASGGVGTYLYSLLDATGKTINLPQSLGRFTHLAAGKYKIKVESADCTPVESQLISINEPAEKLFISFSIVDVSCAGASNGKIQIDITGGTPGAKLAISPNLSQFVTTNLFENLSSGSYDVLVQDALGCLEKRTVFVHEPQSIAVQTVMSSIVQERCFNDKNAKFSVAISGGILPYSVALDQLNLPFVKGIVSQTQFDFANLSGGSHTLYVKDANNCRTDWTINLAEPVILNPTTTIHYDCVSNVPQNSVTVQLDLSKNIEFSLDGGVFQTINLFSNLSAGNHYVRVKHTNGCIKDTPVFSINRVDPLNLILKQGGLNEIVAEAKGGFGNYTFTFDGEHYDANPRFLYTKTQEYLVTVQDANGCTTSLKQQFNYIDICIPNYFTPNGDGLNENWAPGCTIYYKNLTFTILDRYGRELGTYSLGESWDGKYQGVEMPAGDYWYVLQLNSVTDDRKFVGHFTLFR